MKNRTLPKKAKHSSGFSKSLIFEIVFSFIALEKAPSSKCQNFLGIEVMYNNENKV